MNEAEQQNLAKAASEIQALLKKLEPSYPTDTTDRKKAIATEVIKQIDSNFTLAERILSALKAGRISALEQLINHPAASLVIKHITVHGNYYKQSGNIGAGHVSESKFEKQAMLGGVINEAEQHPKTTQGETGQERKQEKSVSRFGKLKSEDQKYDGSLVRIGLNFFNYSQPNQQTQQPTGLLLDISFGEVEENYIEPNKLGIGQQERPI